MKYPNFSEEKKLWKQGYKRVAGTDEAGRGPLAGPVVAAAVMIDPEFKFALKDVKDSKKLTFKKREELYSLLTRNPQIEWGAGRVSEGVIDKINIFQAARLAMKRAVMNLEKKLKEKRIDFLILDGRMRVDLEVPQKPIVKGDYKVFSCSAASIIAKVTRDRIMLRYDKQYPQYGFLKHKGYGTRLHFEMLKKHGSCPIHRKSFSPVNNFCKR